MKALWLCVVAVVICYHARGAETSSAAQARARSYQESTQDVLLRHGWRISRNEWGLLVADHPVGDYALLGLPKKQLSLTDSDPQYLNMLDFTEFARLALSFVPESAMHTNCTANIVLYHYDRTYRRKLSKPYPFNNPDSTKKIQGMMAEAERQLTSKHPEYAAH